MGNDDSRRQQQIQKHAQKTQVEEGDISNTEEAITVTLLKADINLWRITERKTVVIIGDTTARNNIPFIPLHCCHRNPVPASVMQIRCNTKPPQCKKSGFFS
ncbi:uncharacterized protein V6R79_022333 [Siganus canaliculatus]